MNALFIFDPTIADTVTRDRGGGRIVQILKENLLDRATCITDFEKVPAHSTLLIPSFNPFQKPILSKRLARKQLIMIFDVIPLKYPSHFPVGIKGKINLFLNKKALKQYDLILTLSHKSKIDIARYLNIPDGKIKVIYPTVSNIFSNSKFEYLNPKSPKMRDPAEAGKIQNSNDKNPKRFESLFRISNLEMRNYCLYVGDVNWNKNLVNLARAIKIADVPCIFVGKNFRKDFRLFLAKPDPALRETLDSHLFSHPWQKEFKDFLTEINEDPRFIFADYKTDEELIKLYKQSRCNILLSHDEGFGFSYLEASTLGRPSVLSDIPVFHEVAENTALFANPNDPKDIARKIRQIFDDDALRTKLSFKAQERSRYFNAEKFKKELTNLF